MIRSTPPRQIKRGGGRSISSFSLFSLYHVQSTRLRLWLHYIAWRLNYIAWTTLAPARKLYQIGLLLTHKNGDFVAVSVTVRSCAAPILTRVLKVDRHIGFHTRPAYFSCWHVIFSLKQFAGVMVCSCWSREKSGGFTWLVELRRHLENSIILSGSHEARKLPYTF